MTPLVLIVRRPPRTTGKYKIGNALVRGIMRAVLVKHSRYAILLNIGANNHSAELRLNKEMKHTVIVWDKLCDVEVYQKSKSRWEAVGDYMSQIIRITSTSEGAALKLWRETAKYRGG